MSEAPGTAKRKGSLRSPELWVGLILGAFIGRTAELIPDHTWAYLVLLIILLLPALTFKDWVTAKLYAKRDAIVAKPQNHMPNRRRLLRLSWNLLDFVVGALILLVPSFALAIAWANLKPFG